MKVTLELVAAFKRKNVKDIMTLIVAEHNEELAKEVTDAGRLTNALIDRTIGTLVGNEVEEFKEPLPEFAEQAVEDAEEFVAQLQDLDMLIEAGKYKKAKKLLKAIKETGIKGSEINKRAEQVKALKETK